MRHVDDHARGGLAHRVDHRLIGFGHRVIVAFQRGRRGKEREMLAALDQSRSSRTSSSRSGATERIGNALAGLVVEIQAQGAERQVEIHDRGVDVQLLGDAPADIMGDGGGAGAAAGADKGDDPADRGGAGIEIEPGDHFDQLQRRQRRHQILRRRGASIRGKVQHRWCGRPPPPWWRDRRLRPAAPARPAPPGHAAASPQSADWA